MAKSMAQYLQEGSRMKVFENALHTRFLDITCMNRGQRKEKSCYCSWSAFCFDSSTRFLARKQKWLSGHAHNKV